MDVEINFISLYLKNNKHKNVLIILAIKIKNLTINRAEMI